MPEGFDRCVKNGGDVWTEKLSGGRYRHVCRDKSGKKWLGHIKKKKKSKGKS